MKGRYEMPGHYTTREIADKLQVHQSSVTRLMKDRGIRGEKVFGVWVYPCVEVDALAVTYRPTKTAVVRKRMWIK